MKNEGKEFYEGKYFHHGERGVLSDPDPPPQGRECMQREESVCAQKLSENSLTCNII